MAVDLVNLGQRPNSALRPQQYVEMMPARVRKHRASVLSTYGATLEDLQRRQDAFSLIAPPIKYRRSFLPEPPHVALADGHNCSIEKLEDLNRPRRHPSTRLAHFSVCLDTNARGL